MAQTRTLQVRYRQFDISTPAGTLSSAPQSTQVALGRVILDTLRIRVPGGHAGLTGVAIDYAGVRIVPSEQSGGFLAGDNEVWEFDIAWEVSGPLTVVTFNTDIYAHKHLLRARTRDVVLAQAEATGAGAVVLTTLPLTSAPTEQELVSALEEAPAPEEEAPAPASVGELEETLQ